MEKYDIHRGWRFGHGFLQDTDVIHPEIGEKTVDLPHDYMIEGEVRADAPAGRDSGYYCAGPAFYTKQFVIPEAWKNDRIWLSCDGVMMNAQVDVNSYRVTEHHYGYTPFYTDITRRVAPGEQNRITVHVDMGTMPNSRWYSGAGVLREISLLHAPQIHVAPDGIYARTTHIEYDKDGRALYAIVRVEAEVMNHTDEDHIVNVTAELLEKSDSQKAAYEKDAETPILTRTQKIQVDALGKAAAYLTLIVPSPRLWSAESPELYTLRVRTEDVGVFRTSMPTVGTVGSDEQEILFGIRMIQADAISGLRINGQQVKLKGGCLHHDNGILGGISLYDAEVRKLKKLKSSGFNAVRTAHNPPSVAFLDACDRAGMYVIDEAFDCWGMGKRPGDYHMYFDTDWEKDMEAYMRRDRSRACVIMWSIGNEIEEHGGMGNGYSLATKLAEKARSIDSSRLITNANCSYWTGLDEKTLLSLLREMGSGPIAGTQNADLGEAVFADRSEPFMNGLDVCGYNYLEAHYEENHKLYPERVMVGTETFPNEFGKNWPMVQRLPYAIGDFTWAAWDYIGEAGIGKSMLAEKTASSPIEEAMMLQASPFPWRTGNCGDFDINGQITVQGLYRRIVFGSRETAVFSYAPAEYGKNEIISKWGFPHIFRNWNWKGCEGKKVLVVIFSRAEEAELFVGGQSLGRKKKGEALLHDMPDTFTFEAEYAPGKIRAVSYEDGTAVSEDALETTGAPAHIHLTKEDNPADSEIKKSAKYESDHLVYVDCEITDEDGRVVPTGEVRLTAKAEDEDGCGASLAGFGSGNPSTTDNYTSGVCTSFRGRALAVVRFSKPGKVRLTVESPEVGTCFAEISG